MNSQLTIQMVTWNSADDLKESLPVLASFPSEEITFLVIDNGSADESVSLVKKLLPSAEVIELSKNHGFAGAHNIGFAQNETELVMVCNPDLLPSWRGIQETLQAFEDEKVGSAQGLLLRAGNTPVSGNEVTSPGVEEVRSAIIDSAGIVMTKALNGKESGAGEIDSGQYDTARDVDACTGATAIYRMTALRQVPHGDTEIFDEDFFAYKEDVDLGWRLRRAGWKNMFVPVIQGTHARSLSHETPVWQRMSDARTRYSFRNWIWMIYKNATIKELLLHEIFIDARLLAWAGLTILKPSFLKVWLETFKGLPKMIAKR